MRLRPRRRAAGTRPTVPPERIELDGLVLARLTADDAPTVSAAAVESLDHLRPWMPWATPEGTSLEAQRERLLGPASAWTPGSDYGYGMFLPDGRLVGGIGLHRRIGRSALEIGYWVHVDHTRRGIAAAAAAALTAAGFALRGIERMEIHCDEANVASAAVPRRLGYRLAARVDHEPEAPGETGTRLVWVVHRREWEAGHPRGTGGP
ncbi:MAG TPA: GNAT family protein [Acidimicrobiales bacterium]|nr:GNAT family protein [Acidimicrobiales bacterium]